MIYIVLSEKFKSLKTTGNKEEAEKVYKENKLAYQILEQSDKFATATIIKRKY
jgi:hypothetical protein